MDEWWAVPTLLNSRTGSGRRRVPPLHANHAVAAIRRGVMTQAVQLAISVPVEERVQLLEIPFLKTAALRTRVDVAPDGVGCDVGNLQSSHLGAGRKERHINHIR